jgi:hypothetical protein
MAFAHRTRSPLSLAATCVFLIASVWVVFNTRRWNNREVFQWDSDGYYLYLPATIIHQDLMHLAFLDTVLGTGKNGGYRFGQGAFPVEATGRMCNKYTLGCAVFELPFFLVAHAWCVMSGTDAADGYSPPYQLAVALASAVWAWLGLLVLIRFLLKHLSDRSTVLVVLTLGMGTNLFFYASYASGMSHPFLFFLCTFLIDRTDRWYNSPTAGSALAIGVCIGLAVLTRPTCMLFALIPICWRISTDDGHASGLALLRAHWQHTLIAAGIALICVLPQMFFWKATTGAYLFYSYGGEGFDFLHPHVMDGLFSFRKGLFVYSPLVSLGAVGMIFLQKRTAYRTMLLCFFIPFLYLTFSWKAWWYGGGFGSRVMIDALPLLALPMGLLMQWAIERGRVVVAGLMVTIALGISLNLFQQWQYLHGILHYENMTQELYWQTFLSPSHEAAGIPLGQ